MAAVLAVVVAIVANLLLLVSCEREGRDWGGEGEQHWLGDVCHKDLALRPCPVHLMLASCPGCHLLQDSTLFLFLFPTSLIHLNNPFSCMLPR